MNAMDEVLEQLKQLNASKLSLRTLSTMVKNQVLLRLAEKLIFHEGAVLDANRRDVEDYQRSTNFQKAFLDRLILNPKRLQQMAVSLREVAALNDPVGEIIEARTLENGLVLKRSRNPLGVIFLIFEARPNVITEAFSLAFKAGNALILKGGKESKQTSAVIYQIINQTMSEFGVDSRAFWGLSEVSRETTDFLLRQNKWIDVLIPRGGERLIEYVTQHSTIPMIKNDRGLCHLYVHQTADLEMAVTILDNAKTQRPSVCNAVETVLVDEAVADYFLPFMYSVLRGKGVEFFVCPNAYSILGVVDGVYPADPKTFDTEYLDLKLSVKIVKDLSEAIQHIEVHGSRHSESIVTADQQVAQEFQSGVDAAAVYWNASTRFTDGGQFGLGAEIGISTQKLHVRGPVGLEHLTSVRWIIEGDGQVRPG